MFKKFRKDQVNEKLRPLGWEIPKGIQYKGMLHNHAVRCLKCGWIQEKRLDNLIYRKEQCPMCGNGVFEETLQGSMDELHDTLKTLGAEILDLLKAFDHKEKGIPQNDLKALFRRYIAKKGVQLYGRKMMSDEWYDLSHNLSEELMLELATSQEEFDEWEDFYTDLLNEFPTKQGQDILFAVIPPKRYSELGDAITKRLVKM